jgi:hypothetical protein
MSSQIKWVLLYRTPGRWRISVAEESGAIACGDLPDTAPDVPAGIARQDMLDHLRRYWNFAGELTWHELEPGRLAAEPRHASNLNA